MLQIRQEQYDRFKEDALKRYKARLEDHLVECFPLPMGHAGAQGRAAVVDLAVARAAAHGLETVATVQVFADHILYLGAFWDEGPLLAPIAAPLGNLRPAPCSVRSIRRRPFVPIVHRRSRKLISAEGFSDGRVWRCVRARGVQHL